MKKRFLSFIVLNMVLLFSVYAQVDVELPKGQIQIIDNFENGNYWIWAGSDWDRYGSHKSSWGCNLSKKHITEGNYSMELLIEPVVPGSSANFFYDGSQDLSGGRYIACDLYNDSPNTITVSVVLQATDNWNWLESEHYQVPPGKHTVLYDVSHLNQNFNDVRRINIAVYFVATCNRDTSLFVDNMILIK